MENWCSIHKLFNKCHTLYNTCIKNTRLHLVIFMAVCTSVHIYIAIMKLLRNLIFDSTENARGSREIESRNKNKSINYSTKKKWAPIPSHSIAPHHCLTILNIVNSIYKMSNVQSRSIYGTNFKWFYPLWLNYLNIDSASNFFDGFLFGIILCMFESIADINHWEPFLISDLGTYTTILFLHQIKW